MDTHQNVPLSTVTGVFNRIAKRATTNTEKAYLYEIVDGLGQSITSQNPGVKREEFFQQCGVSMTWGAEKAA